MEKAAPTQCMIMKQQRILILGVGNILLHDEGVGVYVVRDLEANYIFSDEITLLDGGTLGMRLLDAIGKADVMIVADTLSTKGKPGTIHRLAMDELKNRVAAKNSLHQVSFLETLAYAEFLGILPETVLIGCEPENLSAWGTDLSQPVAQAKPYMIEMVLSEVERAGGSYRARVN